MKQFLFVLLSAVLPISLFAQTDTISVPTDLGSGGNLNTAIANVITADPTGKTLSNTVFKLAPDGSYILTGTITTPAHAHLYLVGPTPGNTQATALPQILWTTSGGVTTTYNFDCYGDLTMKNVWILCANVGNAQIGTSIVIEDDSLANLPGGKGEHLDMEGCIIDCQSIGNGGGAIEPSCQHFRGSIINTYFRNFTDPHYRYYGRPVSWTYGSTTWHTDTLAFENCTFANCGYVYMQESPEYADHVSFNHCTFANTMMFTLESSYWWWLSVTNCVFVNSFMFGDVPSADGGGQVPNGGAINIDSAASFTSLIPPVPFSDSSTAPKQQQRHILFANNSYGFEKWYTDFLVSNVINDTAQEANKEHAMPMMSGKTYRNFFGLDSTGKKRFPYMNAVNLYPSSVTDDTSRVSDPTKTPGVDPVFVLNPCNINGIEAFLIGRWATGVNVSWAYDSTADLTQGWPMNEDLSYSNATLLKAAMGGFPLGDLYHWGWPPAQYGQWATQAATEHATILNWLTTGVITSVKAQPTAIPGKFDLSQNYPNPFNPTTTINYSVAQTGNVSLKVYNLLGQEVATLYSGVQQIGNHTAVFDGSRFASGVYFYRLEAGNNTMTKKLVLMK